MFDNSAYKFNLFLKNYRPGFLKWYFCVQDWDKDFVKLMALWPPRKLTLWRQVDQFLNLFRKYFENFRLWQQFWTCSQRKSCVFFCRIKSKSIKNVVRKLYKVIWDCEIFWSLNQNFSRTTQSILKSRLVLNSVEHALLNGR